MLSRPIRPHSTALFYTITTLYWASMYVYQPILAVHAENMGASGSMVGAVVGAYGFSQLMLRIPLGVWSDRVGVRKPFMLIGLASAGLGALGMGLATDPTWLVVGRAMSGVGAAAWVAFTVLFSSYFAPEDATRAMTRLVFISAASPFVSTYAGGLIAQSWGWTAPFYVALAMALMGAAAASLLQEKALPLHRDAAPRDILRIGTTPLLLAVSFTAMLTSWTQWATANGFSVVYAARLGATRADMGTLTTLFQGAYTLSALVSAFLVGRIGLRGTVILGLAMQTVGALVVPLTDSLLVIGLTQALQGSRGLAYPLLMGLSIRAVPAADRATAMGVFQAVYALGMFGGPATTGFLADTFGLTSVFLVGAAATFLGIGVVLTKVKD